MKRYSILILTLLSLLYMGRASAQEVIYSPYDKFDFRSGEFSVVGKVGGLLYVYRGSSEGYYLDAYDDNMERRAMVILDFIPRKSFATHFITYPDKLIVLYQTSEGNQVQQYAAMLDGRGRLQKGPVLVDEVKASFLGGRSGLYGEAVSHDKQRIAVYGAGTHGRELNVRVIWLDSALNRQSLSVARFEADNNIAFGEGVVNNDGKFFLPAYTPFGSKDYADRIWLLSLNMGEHKFISAMVPLGELFASGTYMELSNDGDRIYIGGFYAERKNGNFEGIIYTFYDVAANEFREFKEIMFSESLRNASGDKNKKRAFNDYKVRQLIVRNDGGFVMISEDFYVTSRNSYNSGFGYYSWYYPAMTTSIREYNYGDILAVACGGDGKPEWTEFIRKYQYSQEDGGLFSSYALINTGGSLGFLFNDFNMNRSRVQLASLDASGQVNIATLDIGNSPPDWLPKSGKQVSGNSFVVPCLKKNQICFAKVVF